jgi:hypothetical protein
MESLIKSLGLFLLLSFPGLGQTRTWDLGVAGGAVYNAKTPLRVHQNGFEKIRMQAHYRTEPFQPPVYYDLRLSSWQADRGWELKFTHHKLILENLPPEIQRFSITDGFNLLTLNRTWLANKLYLSAGMGLVITHPESTVRQKQFPENKGFLNQGYYISGPTLELSLAKRYYFSRRWYLFGEGRATVSYVKVPVWAGHADVSNAAFHFLVGSGFRISAQPAGLTMLPGRIKYSPRDL